MDKEYEEDDDMDDMEVMVTPRENVTKLVCAMSEPFIPPEYKVSEKRRYRQLIKDFKLMFKHANEYDSELDGYILSKNSLDLCANAFYNHFNEHMYFDWALSDYYDLIVNDNGDVSFSITDKGREHFKEIL